MYLDHINKKKDASILDIFDASTEYIEVYRSVESDIIKNEAALLFSLEDGNNNRKFWDKLRVGVRKIWEAFKNVITKVLAFVVNLPNKILIAINKIIAKYISNKVTIEKIKAVREKNLKGDDSILTDEKKIINIDIVDGCRTYFIKSTKARYKALENAKTLEEVVKIADGGPVDTDFTIKGIKTSDPEDHEDFYISLKDAKIYANDICAILDADNSSYYEETTKELKDMKAEFTALIKDTSVLGNSLYSKELDEAYDSKDEDRIKIILKKLSFYRSEAASISFHYNKYAKLTLKSLNAIFALCVKWIDSAIKNDR